MTAPFDPAVYVQGSFRLGLVNRPLGPTEEDDLDLVCELRGLSKTDITQERLKALLGAEIQRYTEANGILDEPVEKRRCWRIDYEDEVNFHIDNLVCVPKDEVTLANLIPLGVSRSLAETSVALTCKDHRQYRFISDEWPSSNPAGFGSWFESRFGTVGEARRRLLVESGVYETIDAVPVYALKTPLQRSIQLLKRHRDIMFRNHSDFKPISIIIATLSADAYRGEEDVHDALMGILERIPAYVLDEQPRIPNPVNPAEDFADKWASDAKLEDNFWRWHDQACRDFGALASVDRPEFRRLSESRLAIHLPEDKGGSPAFHIPRRTTPVVAVDYGPKPWG